MAMSQNEILKVIMEKAKVSSKDLKQQLTDEFNSLDKTIPEDVRKVIAFNRVVSSYRKILTSRASTYKGIFIGATTPRDMIFNRRRDALELYNLNKEEAIKTGKTDSSGRPLYYATPEEYAKLPDFAKERIGKPMPESDLQRIAFGLVKEGERMVPCILRLRGENTKVNIPFFTEGTFPALKLQNSTEDLIRVNDSGAFSFESNGTELTEEQTLVLIKEHYKDRLITLSQLDAFLQEHQEFERFAIMKVMATEIIPTLTRTGSQQIRVQDDTIEFIDDQGNILPPILCFVPTHIPLNFPEKSEIYIVGQPNITDRGKNINVLGIYVPRIYRNMVPKDLPTEEEIMKW